VLALSDMRDRFRLVLAAVENVDLPQPMPNLPVGRAVWRSKPDFKTATTAWMMAGAAHHSAMSNQLSPQVIEDFARIMGVELVLIDDGVTLGDIENSMRVNAAHYGSPGRR